jgi:hypothetical protein
MSDTIDSSSELLPEPRLIAALTDDISTSEKAAVLARLRRWVEKNRKSLEEHARKFNEMYEEAGRKLPAEGLFQLAERIHQAEKSAAEQLDPWLQALQQALVVPSHEPRQCIEELIEIAVAWLAVYRDTRARLLKLATDRGGDTRGTLRARPVQGDVDHDALSREFMARFPKIRAALAK